MSDSSMNGSPNLPERRKRDLRDTALWERDLNGYAVCPWCAAMVYSPRADFHQQRCAATQPERRGRGAAEDEEGT